MMTSAVGDHEETKKKTRRVANSPKIHEHDQKIPNEKKGGKPVALIFLVKFLNISQSPRGSNANARRMGIERRPGTT